MNKAPLFAALAAIALASCSSDDQPAEPTTQGEPIRLNAAVAPVTRADGTPVEITDDNLTNVNYCFSFCLTDENPATGEVKTEARQALYSYVYPYGNMWHYNDLLYWRDRHKYKFYAFSPNKALTTTKAYGRVTWDSATPGQITFSDDGSAGWQKGKNNGCTDLLYEYKEQTGRAEQNDAVDIVFKHALAKVDFALSATLLDDYGESQRICFTDVQIEGVYKSGRFVIIPTTPASGKWTNQTGSQACLFQQMTGHILSGQADKTCLTPSKFVIPTNAAGSPDDALQQIVVSYKIQYEQHYDPTATSGSSDQVYSKKFIIRPSAHYRTADGGTKYLAEFLPGHHYRFTAHYDEQTMKDSGYTGDDAFIRFFCSVADWTGTLENEVDMGGADAPVRTTRSADAEFPLIEHIPLVW